MNIPKAIEILQLNLKLADKKMPPDCRDAVHLGIEALTFKKALADSPYGPRYEPLPGETKD